MTINSTKHNALIHRVIQKIAPPNSHRSLKRCFLLLSFVIVASFMVSCDKDAVNANDAIHANMLDYYAESRGLMETSADSVVNYYNKLAGFHRQYPECEADELFRPTVTNLGDAFKKYGIVQIGGIIIFTEWEGEIEIKFLTNDILKL